MYKISLIENGTKQNEITIADTVALFQFVHKLTTGYKNVILKIEEC